MALLAAAVLTAAAVALGLAASWAAGLAGPAVVLAVLASTLVALALFAQLRAERRYRWALQKRVAELQRGLGDTPAHRPEGHTLPAGTPERPGPERAGELPVTVVDYAYLARIHDRLHALEYTLGPRP